MKIEKGLIFLVIVLLIIPIASAVNGCCGEKNGMYCVYTAESECSSPDKFVANAECSETSFCKTGCCITPDGICAQQTGKYNCEMNNGEWSEDATCSFSDCNKICCAAGSSYSYTTAEHCEYLWEDYEVEVQALEVSSELECIEMSQAQELGCCVTEDSCGYVAYSECENPSIDVVDGYGFYKDTLCSIVSAKLENYKAGDSCDCETDYDSSFCDYDKAYYYDTCGNKDKLKEDCDYPNKMCNVIENEAVCTRTSCDSTFKFPEGSVFEKFNSYDVYYKDDGKEWADEPVTLNLGDARRNGESWCVYESPTGAFSDRIGSQHYYVYCDAGVEHIETCGNDRSEICITNYNPETEEFSASCEDNNFDDYYGETDTNYGEYVDEPIVDGGVSTVPIAGVFWEEEESEEIDSACALGGFVCNVIYGQTKEGEGEDKGIEAYINTVCMRPEFIFLAADYCRAQGSCGYNLNLLEKESNEDTFNVDYGGGLYGELSIGDDALIGVGKYNKNDDSNLAHLSHEYYKGIESSLFQDGFSYGGNIEDNINADYAMTPDLESLGLMAFHGGLAELIIAIQENSIYGCFNRDLSGGEGMDYARILQGQDYFGPKGCYLYSEEGISEVYYSVLKNIATKPKTLSRDFMVNPWWGLETVIVYSTAYINSKDDEEERITHGEEADGRDRHPEESKSKRLSRLAEGLGFNIPENSADDIHTAVGVEYLPQYFNQLEEDYGKLNPDLYFGFSSIKPWTIDKTKVSTTGSPQENPEGLSVFKGERGDNEESEYEKIETLIPYPVTFTCNNWEGPKTEYDCSLCDKPMSEGGLVFDSKEGMVADSYCNPWRCKSLSPNCVFVEENIGTGKDTCLDGGCELTDAEIFYDEEQMQILDSTQYVTQKSDDGYTMENLPVGSLVNVGIKTDMPAKCVFLESSTINPSEIKIVDSETDTGENEYTYSMLSSIALDETGALGLSEEHNISISLWDGNSETVLYVWCENYCDRTTQNHFQINLKTGDAPDYLPPTIKVVEPSTESYLPYGITETQVSLYLDKPATCKYSNTPTDDYNLMENTFSYNSEPAQEGLLQGYFISSTNLPVNDGANTFYFNCKSQSDVAMSTSYEYTVTKTQPLLISQTSPSGTLYYDEITLQVRTQSGAEQGKSICYFKQSYQNSFMEMFESQDDGSLWLQQQGPLGKGTYTYDIYCEDIAGNKNETKINFIVDIDEYAPKIEQIYYLGSTIYIITDEVTDCEYNTESFAYGAGFDMAGSGTTDHSFTVNPEFENYYTICEDIYGNNNSPTVINLEYLEGL